ncbi:MAG: hypothetical protein HYT64_00945 [Candidatus Yanofskybacteria bacterium]|nr:hypothetical protein [Candidatus Yanofskybacteria bacterium]
MEILERLNKETYVVEHSPNCPSPFLVRLVGPESGVIDKKYYDETNDILGFGKTLEEAAQAAFTKQTQYASCMKIARKFGWSTGVTWQKVQKIKEVLSMPTLEDAIEFLSEPYINRNNRFVLEAD